MVKDKTLQIQIFIGPIFSTPVWNVSKWNEISELKIWKCDYLEGWEGGTCDPVPEFLM